MTIVETSEIAEVSLPGDIDLLIKEARRRSRRRRLTAALVVVSLIVGLALVAYGGRRIDHTNTTAHHEPGAKTLAASTQNAVTSLYPATLTMSPGLLFSAQSRVFSWGAVLSATQSRWVKIKSTGATMRWGVWRPNGLPPLYPVRSVNGGLTWTVAGPALATDWAGGSLYYVTRVIAESASAVVMVSNSIIDVSTDAGHHWYQYLNPADIWNMTGHHFTNGRIGLRVGPDQWTTRPPKNSFALYVLNVAQHQWHRVSQSLG